MNSVEICERNKDYCSKEGCRKEKFNKKLSESI